MDFDPRDFDSRDEERFNTREDKSSGHDSLDRDDIWLLDVRSRDPDDDARELGRGPGDARESNTFEDGRDPREDARWTKQIRELFAVVAVLSTARDRQAGGLVVVAVRIVRTDARSCCLLARVSVSTSRTFGHDLGHVITHASLPPGQPARIPEATVIHHVTSNLGRLVSDVDVPAQVPRFWSA